MSNNEGNFKLFAATYIFQGTAVKIRKWQMIFTVYCCKFHLKWDKIIQKFINFGFKNQ